MKDYGKCQHNALYCVKSYPRQGQADLDFTDKDCRANCRDPDCPLARPALCGHRGLKCPNGNCPSNCDNKSCPGIPNLHDGEPIPPSQWRFKDFIFPIQAILCLAAFGLPNPDVVWQKMEFDWDEAKSNVVDRLNNAGLIVCDFEAG